MTTLTNSYHHTECRTRLSNHALDTLVVRLYDGTATNSDKATARRIRKALCGSQDCKCGDSLKRRP